MTEEDENFYIILDLLVDSVRTGNRLRWMAMQMTLKYISGKGWLELEPNIEAPYDCIRVGDEGQPEVRIICEDIWVPINDLTDLQISDISMQLLKSK